MQALFARRGALLTADSGTPHIQGYAMVVTSLAARWHMAEVLILTMSDKHVRAVAGLRRR